VNTPTAGSGEDTHFSARIPAAIAAISSLSAWEAVLSGPVTWSNLRGRLSTSDRERPLFTVVNGPLMARRLEA
jgi:hypothetical protein